MGNVEPNASARDQGSSSREHQALLSPNAHFATHSVTLSPERAEILMLCEKYLSTPIPYKHTREWIRDVKITTDFADIKRIFHTHNQCIMFRMPQDEEILVIGCGNGPTVYRSRGGLYSHHLHPGAYTVDKRPDMNPCVAMDWTQPESRSALNRRFSVIIDEGSLCSFVWLAHCDLTDYFNAAVNILKKDGLLLLTSVNLNKRGFRKLNIPPSFENKGFFKSENTTSTKEAELIAEHLSSPCPGLIENLKYLTYHGILVLKMIIAPVPDA